MSQPEHPELIIIRRYEEEEHEHHSSAWKVAHADFMTAMMAFFLIMWLINVTDEDTRKAIANYFNPVSLAESVTDAKGLNDPVPAKPSGPKEGGVAKPTPVPVPGVESGAGTVDEKPGSPDKAAALPATGDAARERAAFQDPYAILAKLAAEAADAKPMSADVPLAETSLPGVAGGEIHRDPFDPVYWQMAVLGENKSSLQGDERRAEPVPDTGTLDAGSATQPSNGVEPPILSVASPSSSSAAVSDSVASTAPDQTQSPEATKAKALADELAEELKTKIGNAAVPHLEVRETSEGLLISLTDDVDFSMFAVGSAIPDPKVVVAMQTIGEALTTRLGPIVVRGYTDGRPFRSDTYDNWRLSSARAHMAYYMLTRAGLEESRFRRIESFADRGLRNPQDPNAAENRRIEILLENESS